MTETDLAAMDPSLRSRLLTWRFAQQATTLADRDLAAIDRAVRLASPPTDNLKGRFKPLVEAGLLLNGEEVQFSPTNRQRRAGAPALIGGARVRPDGSVEYGDVRYSVVNDLARALADSDKRTERNLRGPSGWTHLCVMRDGEAVPLGRLRRDYLEKETVERAMRAAVRAILNPEKSYRVCSACRGAMRVESVISSAGTAIVKLLCGHTL